MVCCCPVPNCCAYKSEVKRASSERPLSFKLSMISYVACSAILATVVICQFFGLLPTFANLMLCGTSLVAFMIATVSYGIAITPPNSYFC